MNKRHIKNNQVTTVRMNENKYYLIMKDKALNFLMLCQAYINAYINAGVY